MNRPDDHEAKMARADLFKLAQYSFKLFKMIQDNQELEGWVQAKITKAADYISSVYHYMQYEMKVSEYGDHLENAEMYSESVRKAFEQKLDEARNRALKIKMKALSESRRVAVEDGSAPPPKGPDGQYPIITSGPNKGKRWTPQAPGPTNPPAKTPPPGVQPPANKAVKEALKGGQKKLDVDKDGKLEKSDFAKLRSGKGVKEAAKPDYIDLDKDGNKKEPMKKAAKDMSEADAKCNHTPKGKSCPVHGLKECGGMYEGVKDMEKAVKDKNGPQPKGGSGRKTGKGYDSETNVRKPPEGKVPFTSFHQGKAGDFDARSTALAAKGKLVKGKAQSAAQPKDKHGVDEGASHQAKTTMKHVKDPTPGEKKAAKDIKPGIAGYKDRVDMLKSAEKDGRLKEAKSAKQQAAIAIAKKAKK